MEGSELQGCSMRRLFAEDIAQVPGVLRNKERINEIHRWALGR